MKEKSVTFNHGYLCQMLHAASDLDLDLVIDDVKKEQERRNEKQRAEYANNILHAIHKAVDNGYLVTFSTKYAGNTSELYRIHENNLPLTTISIDFDEEDE